MFWADGGNSARHKNKNAKPTERPDRSATVKPNIYCKCILKSCLMMEDEEDEGRKHREEEEVCLRFDSTAFYMKIPNCTDSSF